MISLSELKNKWQEGRLGFRMDEVMSGEHWFEPGCGPTGTHPFEFRVTWGPKSFRHWLDKSSYGLVSDLCGTVHAAGLCDGAPCEGSLEMRYFDEHKIRYTFDFEVEKQRYHFIGEKMNIRPWNLPYSHTTCFGTLIETDSGKLISRSLTHFRVLSAPSFVRSLRFA